MSPWQLEMRNYLLLEEVLSVLQSPRAALPLLLTLPVIGGLQVANEILQTQAHGGDWWSRTGWVGSLAKVIQASVRRQHWNLTLWRGCPTFILFIIYN